MKKWFVLIFALVLTFSAPTAGAALWDKPTDAEVAALPPYCMAKFRGVNVEKWKRALGSIYEHVHHYCGALVYISRYYRSTNPQDRKFFMNNIITNLNYMTSHADQNSPLMPEIYSTKGRFLMLDGRISEGLGELLHAIQLKPDYIAPYLTIADYYTQNKNKQDALKILRKGLHNAPSSPILRQRYQKLGGNLSLIEKPTPEDDKSQIKSQPGLGVEKHTDVEKTVTSSAAQGSEPKQTSPSDASSGKIGNPTNPWCRFCPPSE